MVLGLVKKKFWAGRKNRDMAVLKLQHILGHRNDDEPQIDKNWTRGASFWEGAQGFGDYGLDAPRIGKLDCLFRFISDQTGRKTL